MLRQALVGCVELRMHSKKFSGGDASEERDRGEFSRLSEPGNRDGA